jgi:hypothetical protein
MTNKEDDNLHKADQVYFLYDPQPVRLLDVIYVGPVMIGVGICTILYNGANFFINEKKAMERRRAEKAHNDEMMNFVPEPLDIEEENYEEMSEAIIKDAPIQRNIEQDQELPVQIDIKDAQSISLPKEVQELINQTNNTTQEDAAIVKKGRGRPSKVDVKENLIENGSN